MTVDRELSNMFALIDELPQIPARHNLRSRRLTDAVAWQYLHWRAEIGSGLGHNLLP
jgi:hypothetical protein